MEKAKRGGMMKKTKKAAWVLLILLLLLIGCILLSFPLGRYPVSIGDIFRQFGHDLLGLGESPEDSIGRVIYNIRLPRILLAVIVGAGLSAAGCAYQCVFQNPMASPDVLGASSGAAFGAALAILAGAASGGITLSAFVMSLCSMLIACLIGATGRDRIMTLVLAGMMISSLFSAGTSCLKLAADPESQLPEITYWLMGSLSGANWRSVMTALIPTVIGMVVLLLLRWRLQLLTIGDEEARALGVHPGRTRLAVILAATLLTAAAISSSGTIGWVGLVIPHMTRKLTGSETRFLLPGTALLGGIFLLVVDNVSRTMLPVELPIGILTAFIGAPFFLWMIVKRGAAR